MNTTVILQSSLRTTAPRLAQPIGRAIAAVAARVSAWTKPHDEHPAEAAARLRQLADEYHTQPSFAADLRAAADRHYDDSEV